MPNIAITTYCNLKCPYCFAQQMFQEKKIKNISIEQLDKILNWIAPQIEETHERIGIIGGEPTLHPDFLTIINHIDIFCQKYNTTSLLFTNGIYLNDQIIKKIPKTMRILINYNDPKILNNTDYILLNNNLEQLNKLNYYNNDKVILGLNLCKEINDYSFFKNIVLKYPFKKFRLAVSFPGQNIDMHQYYLDMKNTFLDIIEFANFNNLKVNMDCRIPISYFSEEEQQLIFKVCGKEAYLRDCNRPSHEIMPDFMMTTCFAHYTNIDCSKYSNFKEYYKKEIESKYYKEEWQYLTNVCLNLTNNCNLQCKYCFVCQKPEYMSLNTGIKIINYLHQNLIIKKKNFGYSKEEKCRISFFGGEPTLLFNEIIMPLTKYINNVFPNDFIITMTTNGTLLNEERIKFLKDNNIEILLSLDGDQTTQDYNRPMKNGLSSFDTISKNLKLLQSNFPELGMRATIYEDTVNNLFDNYLFAIKNNFFFVNFIPDERHPWKEENLKILEQQIEKICLYHLNYFLKNKKFPIHFSMIENMLLEILHLRDRPHKNKNNNINRCGLGTLNGSIDWNGNIFACQEQDSRFLEDINDNIFYIGSIETGISKEKHLKLLNLFKENTNIKCEDPLFCDNCLRRDFCNNDICPSVTYDLFNTFNIANKTHCVYLKSLYNNILAMIDIFLNSDAALDIIQLLLTNHNIGFSGAYKQLK